MEKTVIDIINEEVRTFKEGVGDEYLANKYGISPEFSDFEKQFKSRQSNDEIVYRNADWILYKNPDLNNIGESARGVIDKDGNLFIENFSQSIHHDMIKILLSRGYFKD